MIDKLEFDDYVAGLDALSGFDLYRIFGLIQDSLSNPEKQLEYITQLRIGMQVDYLNAKTEELRRGEVVQILQQFVVVKDSMSELLYKMPPYMLRAYDVDAISQPSSSRAPIKRAAAKKVVKKSSVKTKVSRPSSPTTSATTITSTPQVVVTPSAPVVATNAVPTNIPSPLPANTTAHEIK